MTTNRNDGSSDNNLTSKKNLENKTFVSRERPPEIRFSGRRTFHELAAFLGPQYFFTVKIMVGLKLVVNAAD